MRLEKTGFKCLIGWCLLVCIYKYILTFAILMDRICKFGIYRMNHKYDKIYNMTLLAKKMAKKLHNNFSRKHSTLSLQNKIIIESIFKMRTRTWGFDSRVEERRTLGLLTPNGLLNTVHSDIRLYNVRYVFVSLHTDFHFTY